MKSIDLRLMDFFCLYAAAIVASILRSWKGESNKESHYSVNEVSIADLEKGFCLVLAEKKKSKPEITGTIDYP